MVWTAVGAATRARVADATHPDGSVVAREPATLDPDTVLCTARLGPLGPVVTVPAVAGRPAAAVWYVHLERRDDGRLRHVLLAFDRPVVAAGSVLDASAFVGLPVRNDEQCGTVRWDEATGVVTELLVPADRRRQGIARALVTVAGAVQALGGYGPGVRAGGARSDEGEAVAAVFAPTGRVVPRTARARVEPVATGA